MFDVNFKNIKIVKLHDGAYAIRKGWVFHEYLDFYRGFWWTKDSQYFKDCKTYNWKKVLDTYKTLQNKDTVIKIQNLEEMEE